jgi:hypothetical protein
VYNTKQGQLLANETQYFEGKMTVDNNGLKMLLERLSSNVDLDINEASVSEWDNGVDATEDISCEDLLDEIMEPVSGNEEDENSINVDDGHCDIEEVEIVEKTSVKSAIEGIEITMKYLTEQKFPLTTLNLLKNLKETIYRQELGLE